MNKKIEQSIRLIRFTLCPRALWCLALAFILYPVMILLQHEILQFYGDVRIAEQRFWKLPECLFPLITLAAFYLVFAQLIYAPIREIVMIGKVSRLCVSILLLMLLWLIKIPALVWYFSVYPNASAHLLAIAWHEILMIGMFQLALLLSTRILA